MEKITLLDLSHSQTQLNLPIKQSYPQTIVFWIDKAMSKTIEVELKTKQTQVNILGLVIANKSDEIILKTLQTHVSPKTTSNLLIKSVLGGRAKFHFDGVIKVQRQAQLTDAYQRNENLLLSHESKVVSKPALEILANDVRCTHSATVSHLDHEQLFYLESRGIVQKKAQLMLIESYLSPILEKIGDDKIRKYLINHTQNILESAN